MSFNWSCQQGLSSSLIFIFIFSLIRDMRTSFCLNLEADEFTSALGQFLTRVPGEMFSLISYLDILVLNNFT